MADTRDSVALWLRNKLNEIDTSPMTKAERDLATAMARTESNVRLNAIEAAEEAAAGARTLAFWKGLAAEAGIADESDAIREWCREYAQMYMDGIDEESCPRERYLAIALEALQNCAKIIKLARGEA